MATFNATSQIFGYMDTVVSQFVAANLGRIITAVTPVVALGLTMSLTMEGLFLMARPGHEPLTSLVERFVKYAVLSASPALEDGSDVACRRGHETQTSSLDLYHQRSPGSDQQTRSSVIDKAVDDGLNVAKTAFENAGCMTGPGIATVFWRAVIICTALCAAWARVSSSWRNSCSRRRLLRPVFIFCLFSKAPRTY